MKTNLRKKFPLILLVSPLCLTLFLFPLKGEALTVQEVPNPRQVYGGWVTDQADILSDSTEAQLNQLISQLEAKNGSEIAVVTVTETSPSSSPKAFTTELFNYWGIGKKGQDNGVLFLISVGDRRVEIETGYGVESILPDAKVGNIINTEITPPYKQGDFDGGTLAGTKALVAVLAGATVEDSQYAPTENLTYTLESSWYYIYLAAGGLGLVLTVIAYGSIPKILKKPIVIEPQGVTYIQDSLQVNRSVYILSYIGSFSLIFTLMLLLLASVSANGAGLMASVIGGLLAGYPIYYIVIGTVKDYKQSHPTGSFQCSYCQQPMKKLDSSAVSSYLTQPQQVASELGSINFEGWQCPQCSQQTSGSPIHIRAYVVDSDNFLKCPNCQERTIKRTWQIVKQPTQYSSGKLLITDKCHCCDYYQETEESIPREPPPSSSLGGFGSWGGGDGGSSSGGGSFGGGGSGGDGSFGGGSSGGGGAGGDW